MGRTSNKIIRSSKTIPSFSTVLSSLILYFDRAASMIFGNHVDETAVAFTSSEQNKLVKMKGNI
jgi:hypothetical protein